MILAVIQGCLQADQRVAGENALLHRVAQALFDRGEEVLRNRTAEHFFGEDHLVRLFLRLEADPHVTELTGTAGLLLVAAVGLNLALDFLAVCDAGRSKLGVNAEAALQLGAEHVDLDVALAGNNHLVGLGVVDQVEGNVFLVQPGKAAGDLVVLTLGLREDSHRVAGFRHLDPGKLFFLLRVADGVAGLPVHLADGNDVAAAGILDFGGLLAAHAVEAAELIGGGSAHVAQGQVGSDAALHDLDKAVLAELVRNRLEHEALYGSSRIDAFDVNRGGNIVHHALHKGFGADVLHGGACKHGNHAAILHTGTDTGDHIGFIQFHGVKELFHQFFGGAGCSLHQFHAQIFSMAGIGSRNRTLGALCAVGGVADVVHQVNDALAVGGGDGNRSNDAAVFCTQRVNNRKVIAVFLIALGNHKSGRQIGSLQILPAALGADGDPVLGRAENHTGFDCAQRAQHIADKVKVARAVQDVDLVPRIGDRSKGR